MKLHRVFDGAKCFKKVITEVHACSNDIQSLFTGVRSCTNISVEFTRKFEKYNELREQ